MTRTPSSLAFLALTLSAILAACSSTPAGTNGAGGGSGRGGAAGVVGGGGGGGHLELCGLTVTCKDGVLSGLWGVNCDPIVGTCAFGCRIASASSDAPSTFTTSEAADEFAQTLCNPPPDASSPDAGAASDGGD